MSNVSTAIKQWRRKQKHGAIMEPATFEKVVKGAMRRYGISRKKAERVAGRAYWNTAKAKYRKAT